MGVFYVDDHFPEHPKAVEAGDAACWLYTCGLAYCRRNGTRGAIPKAAAHRLTAANGPRLARRLVEVGLWHDGGDRYLVHDYEEWNARMIARQEQAKRAAKSRWARHPPSAGNAHASADASDSHMRTHPVGQSVSSARAMPCDPKNQVTKQQQASRNTHDPPANPSAAAVENLVEKAMAVIVERRIAAGRAANPDAYRRTMPARLRADHAATIDALDPAAFPTPEALADHLDPPAPRKPADPLEATRAADEARYANHAARAANPCPACAGDRHIDTGDGMTVCAACHGTGTAR